MRTSITPAGPKVPTATQCVASAHETSRNAPVPGGVTVDSSCQARPARDRITSGLSPPPTAVHVVLTHETLCRKGVLSLGAGVGCDTQLPPSYTVFGTVDQATIDAIKKIAAAGTDDSNGPGDGHPKTPVELKTVTIG